MMRACAALLLSACAVPAGQPPPWTWSQRPVQVAALDCEPEVRTEVAWWQQHGAPYLTANTEATDVVVHLSAVPEGFAGWTTQIPNYYGTQARHSEIKLSSCWPAVIRHELGHALGLKHDPDPQNVMHEKTRDQTHVSAAQRTTLE